MLWLLGNGHLWGLQCMLFEELRRHETLEAEGREKTKKSEFPVGRVAKEKNLI